MPSHVEPKVGHKEEDGHSEQEAEKKLPCERVFGLAVFLLEHAGGVLEDEVASELFVFVLHMEHVVLVHHRAIFLSLLSPLFPHAEFSLMSVDILEIE